MAVVHIALQGGFKDDSVVIRVDGKDVFRKDHVTSREQISYADSTEVPVQESQANIEVILPRRHLVGGIKVPTETKMHVGVSIVGGKIECRATNEPFGYL